MLWILKRSMSSRNASPNSSKSRHWKALNTEIPPMVQEIPEQPVLEPGRLTISLSTAAGSPPFSLPLASIMGPCENQDTGLNEPLLWTDLTVLMKWGRQKLGNLARKSMPKQKANVLVPEPCPVPYNKVYSPASNASKANGNWAYSAHAKLCTVCQVKLVRVMCDVERAFQSSLVSLWFPRNISVRFSIHRPSAICK